MRTGKMEIKEKVKENITTSIVKTLKNEGYNVKTNLKYGNGAYRGFQTKYRNHIVDIFAYKRCNDILMIELGRCPDILSSENENKWRSLLSKPGLDLHVIVPSRCKEKVYLKSKILDIPITIHDYNNWEGTFNLKHETFSK